MIAKQEDLKTDNILQLERMNTSFYISVENCEEKNWKNVISAWFHYVEKEWSRFRTDNELFRLNELNMGEKLILSPPLFDVLQKAEDYRKKTNGLFSPYLLPQIQFHGYDQAFPFPAAALRNNELPKVYQYAKSPFEFDVNTNTVMRITPGKIDLGGIGKGYAVQSAARWLKENGRASAGIVDGGGDMTLWSNGEKEWKIGVAHPFEQNKEIAQFRLKNASVATSNIIYRSWKQGNEVKHHILNGKTGMPVESSIIQATVVSSNLLDAEVAAKVYFMAHCLDPEYKKILNINSSILVEGTGKITVDQ